ncbi:3-hydroxyacyl-ACP dehydratase FabZ [Bacteroidales bacterium OttesenSCG-928-K03]|nr:3-hydroxyacyl-ACP dehydratase FabZ [Odoribacter sp. OttesenSCG-928-L07]MDL2239802.1 3-hydroxyacyl-ACP dehydratase FabZ [Bacteroidales bacterium OttesenSCG-928-L14]MDL2243073.1 3-hydroxyacyl-ACP dehydratase FabZ [Bacteroidales bacterium OttesenSCG-928-K03]
MNRAEIKTYLPHREPMLLIDNVVVDENKIAHANYYVTGDEFFLQGHFPGNPVVPGVIICEIMGQACSLLIGDQLIGRTPFYAGLDKVRFKRQVKPKDNIEITARITDQRGLIFFVEAEARVDGELCTKGNLSFALVDNDKL